MRATGCPARMRISSRRISCLDIRKSLLVAGLLACTRPSRAGKLDAGACFEPSDGLPFVMAYRGASAVFPEHSIGAYEAAIDQGAHFIECDVVLSKDLVPVCSHEPNIAQTTNVLEARRHLRKTAQRIAGGVGGADDGATDVVDGAPESPVLASNLTLAEIKQLRAVYPDSAAVAAAVAAGASRPERHTVDAVGACAVPWAVNQGKAAAGSAEAEVEAVPVAYQVASLEDLLQMASAAEPAVGVAVHIQASVWHNSLPQVKAGNTTFEDILLNLLQRYGYAAGPYGSEAWRRRPTYMMAFEACSLKYLAQRTSCPLTQVIGPTIPDTGETWDSATSPEGLARLASYCNSVAVARQQLLAPAATAAGGGVAGPAGGLVASEPLLRMRRAGLQVFSSVFKPAPRAHLLPGARSWLDEVAPVLLGTGLEGHGPGGSRPVAIDGLLTDSPWALHVVLSQLRCKAGDSARATAVE